MEEPMQEKGVTFEEVRAIAAALEVDPYWLFLKELDDQESEIIKLQTRLFNEKPEAKGDLKRFLENILVSRQHNILG